MLVNRSRQMEKRDEKLEFIQTKQTGINEVLLLTQCFIWESRLAYLACVCYENCLFYFIYLFSCTFQFFKKNLNEQIDKVLSNLKDDILILRYKY